MSQLNNSQVSIYQAFVILEELHAAPKLKQIEVRNQFLYYLEHNQPEEAHKYINEELGLTNDFK